MLALIVVSAMVAALVFFDVWPFQKTKAGVTTPAAVTAQVTCPLGCCPCVCQPEKKAETKSTPRKAAKKVVKPVQPKIVAKDESLKASVVAVSDCPNGWSITANAWSLAAMPSDMRQTVNGLVSAAGSRSTYRGDDVSRTVGGQLRQNVKVRTPISVDIRVFYRDPRTLAVVKDLGTIRVVNGTGTFQFPDDPRQWIVETVWPDNFVSPTVSDGKHRLWIFPDEWGKYCTPNMHGIVP